MGRVELSADPEQHGHIPEVAHHPLVLACPFTEPGLQLIVSVSLLEAQAHLARLPRHRLALRARLDLTPDDRRVAAVVGHGHDALLDIPLHGAMKQFPQLGANLG